MSFENAREHCSYSKSYLLVLSINGTMTLRYKEPHGLQTASMSSDHQQCVACLVCTELIGMTQQSTVHQLVL